MTYHMYVNRATHGLQCLCYDAVLVKLLLFFESIYIVVLKWPEDVGLVFDLICHQ